MQLSAAGLRSSQTDLQCAALKTDRQISSNQTDQNLDKRHRDPGADGNQAGNQRQAHPDTSNEPNIVKHNDSFLLQESSAQVRFFLSRRKANSIAQRKC